MKNKDGENNLKEGVKGRPLDALLAAVGPEPEPIDDWEKQQIERKKKGAKILAQAIYDGDTSSVDAIAETICKMYKLGDTLSTIR